LKLHFTVFNRVVRFSDQVQPLSSVLYLYPSQGYSLEHAVYKTHRLWRSLERFLQTGGIFFLFGGHFLAVNAAIWVYEGMTVFSDFWKGCIVLHWGAVISYVQRVHTRMLYRRRLAVCNRSPVVDGQSMVFAFCPRM
jgi:hypothetical protein